jgi:hypothetical protein
MTDDHEAGHGDATLDLIALIEATIKDDAHGLDVLLAGVLASDHLSHVLATLVGILARELVEHHGPHGALELLAHQRSHALDPHECEHAEAGEPASLPDGLETGAADHIAFEISELAEVTMKNGDELRALTRAIERLGDVLDKRLA